jgi:exodeoxyribonuclease V beta subunit
LTPPEILVVTFTEAATQELRDRIRARLTEAAGYFRAEAASLPARPAGEDPIHDLRLEYPPDQWSARAHQLQLAADWMDEAAVSTIHAWCNRMLREHAFDSGSLFTQTLETDQSELRAEVARDYWRTFMVPLDAEAVAEVRRWWPDPAALEQGLAGLIEHADRLDDPPEPERSLSDAREKRLFRLAEIKAPWIGGETPWVEELQQLLDGAVATKRVNGHKLQARFYKPLVAGPACLDPGPASRLAGSGCQEHGLASPNPARPPGGLAPGRPPRAPRSRGHGHPPG